LASGEPSPLLLVVTVISMIAPGIRFGLVLLKRVQRHACQCSLSRIWGGIHPAADDIPGRLIGEQIGNVAFNLAEQNFGN